MREVMRNSLNKRILENNSKELDRIIGLIDASDCGAVALKREIPPAADIGVFHIPGDQLHRQYSVGRTWFSVMLISDSTIDPMVFLFAPKTEEAERVEILYFPYGDKDEEMNAPNQSINEPMQQVIGVHLQRLIEQRFPSIKVFWT